MLVGCAGASYGIRDAFSTGIEPDKVALVPITYDDRFVSWVEK